MCGPIDYKRVSTLIPYPLLLVYYIVLQYVAYVTRSTYMASIH